MRRFAPSQPNGSEGDQVYGRLVSNRRGQLNLSRRELAARVGLSEAEVGRIEDGQGVSDEVRKRLAAELDSEPPGPLRRLFTRVAAGHVERRPELSFGERWERWLWGALAAAMIVLALLIGGRFSSPDNSARPAQHLVAVSDVVGAPTSIHRARVQAQKAAAAEARRAAEARKAAERAAAAAAARKAAARGTHHKNGTASLPVTQPVSPSPSPSGGGGGGSSGPAPQLHHGIGSGGGTSTGSGSGPSGGGSNSTPPPNCGLPGILC